jgi:putative transposase
MVTTYQYRIYPTIKQEKKFECNLEACQTLYNQALHWRKEAYEAHGESVNYTMQQADLTRLREESPFWKSLHIDILQDSLRRLDLAFQAFFQSVKEGGNTGYPKFKTGMDYRSFTYSHLSENLITRTFGRLSRVRIPKVGKVKIRYHRPLPEGEIKTLQVLSKASGWYVNITVEIPDVPKIEIKSAVGVDVGLESFLTTSLGEKVENPRHFRKSEERLAQHQHRFSNRKKGSNRRRKARNQVAKLHERVANQRRDFHYKTAHKLYSKYDAVVVEDFRITNMVQNHHLAKSISDAAWGNFVLRLGNKSEKTGKHLMKVPPKDTSQNCSGCGEKVPKELNVRVHECPKCKLKLDRDVNAAINILRAASALRGSCEALPSPKSQTRKARKTCVESSAVQLFLFQAPPDSFYQAG